MQDRPMYAEVSICIYSNCTTPLLWTERYLQVCEHVVNAIGSGEGVPVSLLARFVKYCLIKRKKADFSTEALKKVSSRDVYATDHNSIREIYIHIVY